MRNGKSSEKVFLKTRNEVKTESVRNSSNLQTQRFLYIDSLSNNYAVEIQPIGPFTYNPFKGFIGQAEKVIVTSKKMQTPKLQKETLSSLEEKHTTTQTTKDLIDYKLKIQQKEKEPNKIIWIIVAGIMLVGLIWWKR